MILLSAFLLRMIVLKDVEIVREGYLFESITLPIDLERAMYYWIHKNSIAT